MDGHLSLLDGKISRKNPVRIIVITGFAQDLDAWYTVALTLRAW
jgi:hypothetical protein